MVQKTEAMVGDDESECRRGSATNHADILMNQQLATIPFYDEVDEAPMLAWVRCVRETDAARTGVRRDRSLAGFVGYMANKAMQLSNGERKTRKNGVRDKCGGRLVGRRLHGMRSFARRSEVNI